MEQRIVKNTSEYKINVMWDGMNHEFEPGEEKMFDPQIAEAIAGEDEGLELVGATKEAATKIVQDKWTERINSKGRREYRHNGQLVSKETWDAHFAA